MHDAFGPALFIAGRVHCPVSLIVFCDSISCQLMKRNRPTRIIFAGYPRRADPARPACERNTHESAKPDTARTEARSALRPCADAPIPPAKSGMAIAGFVLGLIAILTSFLPIINNLSFFLAILGLIFGIIGFVGITKGKKSGRGFAIAAIVLCVVSGAVVLATQSAFSSAIDGASSSTTTSSTTSSSSDDAQSATEQTADANQAADFTVSDEKLNKDSYGATITGTVTNVSGKDKSYVQISYTLYDKEGNLLGNAYANANDLKAGASWKYEAYAGVSDPKAIATFERGDMTSW